MVKPRFFGTAVLVLVALLVGCAGGGPGGGGGGGGKGAGTAATLINFGDAAPDRVLAMQLTIQNVAINQSGGSASSILNAPGVLAVETTHRAASFPPLNINTDNIPAGTFTGVTVELTTAASVTFVDDLGVVQQDNAATVANTTVSVTFPSAVTITDTTAPMVLNLVLSPSSVAINTTTNKATITPTFTATLAPAAASGAQTEATGMTRMLIGVVTATPASGSTQFTLASSQLARSLTFNTDSSTVFPAGSDISSFSGLVQGNIVQVQSQMQANGIPLVTQLDGENAGSGLTSGADIQGIVDTTTVSAAAPFDVTSLGFRVQDAASTAAPPAIGSEITINDFTTPTVFLIDQQDVDLTNLSFTAAFDQVHIREPQEISAIYNSALVTNKPKKLKLRLQTLFGTCGAAVSGTVLNQTLIPLNVPTDSLFFLLTGQSSLTIVRQPSSDTTAQLPNSGVNVHVRGLLFWDDVSGKYFLVADKFTP